VQGTDILALQQGGDGGLEPHFTIGRDHPVTGSRAEKMTGIMRRPRRFERIEPGVGHVQCRSDQTQLAQRRRMSEIVLAIARNRGPQRHIGRARLGEQEMGFGLGGFLVVGGFGVQRQAGAAAFQDPACKIDRTLAIAGQQSHGRCIDTGIMTARLFEDCGVSIRGRSRQRREVFRVGLEGHGLEKTRTERQTVLVVACFGEAETIEVALGTLQSAGTDETQDSPVAQPQIVGPVAQGVQAQIIGPCQIALLEPVGNVVALRHSVLPVPARRPGGFNQGMTLILGSIMTRVDWLPASCEALMKSE